jgi:hypothetical protein
MTWGVVSFIRNEGDIMMKVPTNPDNIKIREETIKLTGVMLGGCISILSALVAILTTIITNFFSNQKSVH